MHLSKSLKKNGNGIILILVSSILACFGQLFWKLSVQWGIPAICAGFLLYGMGAVLMITAYRFGRLSVLQPMMSFGYVLSIILGMTFFHEPLTITKVAGTVCISIGVILIGGGDT
jgi:drug/metabolite transporter (DMT)-like permease